MAPAAQYIPPTSSFFSLLYEIQSNQSKTSRKAQLYTNELLSNLFRFAGFIQMNKMVSNVGWQSDQIRRNFATLVQILWPKLRGYLVLGKMLSYYCNLFWLMGANFLFLMDLPLPLLFIFVLFKHKFYRKNCRRQRDSNSDRRSRRRTLTTKTARRLIFFIVNGKILNKTTFSSGHTVGWLERQWAFL